MGSETQTQLSDRHTDELEFQRYRFVKEDAESFSFAQRLIHIGSDPDNDLVFDHPTVSRIHARLEFDSQGFRLRDLGSKNGTWIGNVRTKEAYVPSGATLRFGDAEVRFELDDKKVQVALSRNQHFGRLSGRSTQMREIFALLEKVASTDVTVLVEGESGTGKELVAEAIHARSAQSNQSMVVFDCSAVAPELVESELFGHVKGAFTGAVSNRPGVFEQAHGSTLFLDEIGELPLELQPKLLRVLETHQFRPVGGTVTRQADVRVIAATNRQLQHEVQVKRFREDLYYRLAVIRVRLPTLRQRPEDIPFLIRQFLDEAGSGDVHVSFETIERLQHHHWPGNVRELKNYVERAVVLAEHGRLDTKHLSTLGQPDEEPVDGDEAPSRLKVDYSLPFKDAKARLLDTFERRYWSRMLDSTEQNISEAARRAGIHRKSLEYLLRKLDLRGSSTDKEHRSDEKS